MMSTSCNETQPDRSGSGSAPGDDAATSDRRAGNATRRPTPKDIWRLVLAVIGVVAVVQELRTPAELRTWHGKVIGFVPYDFRKPTLDRFRRTYWDPDGPLLPGKAWGVGWALNIGAIKGFLDRT